MQRRASMNLPTGRKSSASVKVDLDNVSSPFGDVYRTPCPLAHVRTPRKVSKALGKGGILYGSQESVCSSYLTSSGTESMTMKPGRGLREPSLPRGSNLDLSLMYCHPDPVLDRRSRRCVSEDRSVNVGIGWRGTGGRSRQASITNLADEAFRFLPAESVNQEEPPKLIIKRTPLGSSNQGLSNLDNNYEDNGDAGGDKKKKLSTGSSAADISKREMDFALLINKFESLQELINKVQSIAEQLLQRQTESEDFQKQMKKETEGYDLQRGLYRILEALDGDRRELGRLQKKTEGMKKRQSKGVLYDGENEELSSLLLGANDLEKKLIRAVEELERLSVKTEMLIQRQRSIDEQRRLKMEEEAKKNQALMLLLKDSELLEKLLKDLTEVKTEHMKAQNIHRKIQLLSIQSEDDEMDTDEIILQRIGVDTQTATDNILKTREDIQKLQDAVVSDIDSNIDIVSESTVLRDKIDLARTDVEQLKIDIEEFQFNQKERYAGLMKKKFAEDAERKRKQEEEDKLAVEDADRKQKEERRKKEEEDRLAAEEAERKRKEEQRQKVEADRLAAENERKMREEQERRKRELAEEQDENKIKIKEAELRALQDKLDREAEENRKRQKQEIMNILEGDSIEILKMKDQVLVLVDKQEKIGHIRRKRRELYTIPEEEENSDNLEITGLVDKTAELFNTLLSNEKQISRLMDEVKQKDAHAIMNDVMSVEKDVNLQSQTLKALSKNTDEIYNKHQLMLSEGLKQKGLDDTKKQEILDNLYNEKRKLTKMKGELKNLRSTQEHIGNLINQRTMGEENKTANELELNNLKDNTSKLSDSILKSEKDTLNIEAEIETKDPVVLLSHLQTIESDIERNDDILKNLKEETDECLKKHEQMLRQEIKQKEAEEDMKRQIQEDADSLNKLKNDAEQISVKHKGLEAELLKPSEEDEEEKKRRLAELEKLLRQQKELSEVEKSLEDTSVKYNEWKDFQWTEVEESELQKYGMISSLSMPSFPLGLIKDPALLKAIQKRHAELLELRKTLKRDTIKMQEICEALEEMERRQREAELRRISEQSKEWIKDFVPSGPAEFGAEPVFRSDFHIQPEEARAAAASRKASRMQSRESSVTPLEDIGAARGYEEILLGYTARSRQQSVDRRQERPEDRKHYSEGKSQTEDQRRSRKAERELPIVNIEPTVGQLDENLRKPPTAPRRKREK